MAELEAVSFSCVEQLAVQELGEKAAETPSGSPETEKLIERCSEAPEIALMVVVTDDPCATVRGPGIESDKLDVSVDVDAEVRTISEDDKPAEVVEPWLETAGIAWR